MPTRTKLRMKEMPQQRNSINRDSLTSRTRLVVLVDSLDTTIRISTLICSTLGWLKVRIPTSRAHLIIHISLWIDVVSYTPLKVSTLGMVIQCHQVAQ